MEIYLRLNEYSSSEGYIQDSYKEFKRFVFKFDGQIKRHFHQVQYMADKKYTNTISGILKTNINDDDHIYNELIESYPHAIGYLIVGYVLPEAEEIDEPLSCHLTIKVSTEQFSNLLSLKDHQFKMNLSAQRNQTEPTAFSISRYTDITVLQTEYNFVIPIHGYDLETYIYD